MVLVLTFLFLPFLFLTKPIKFISSHFVANTYSDVYISLQFATQLYKFPYLKVPTTTSRNLTPTLLGKLQLNLISSFQNHSNLNRLIFLATKLLTQHLFDKIPKRGSC
ncbi:hypothetical protein MKW94_024162 [Papaver nudicaule]|uniref:Secreted protein n=1 Tax=Papaver nudicaule TaxID=74823 RepID=A0AA41S129_PAPNU|nr:hypothetical protein [Papaver nudicaule]